MASLKGYGIEPDLKVADIRRSRSNLRRPACGHLHGTVVHTIEWPGLSGEENEEGWILP